MAMTKHYAGSWLERLSEKLRALEPWDSTPPQLQTPNGPHGMLYKEFFSTQFHRTLALVDEAKKTAFLSTIERNLFKFDANSQQYPLMCLCAMLQHGKDSATTQERVMAWIENILARLRTVGGAVGPMGPFVVVGAMEECCTEQFQKFLPLVETSLAAKLADVIGERMGDISQEMVRKVLDKLPLLLEQVFEVVDKATKDLNMWMQTAPRFPATPLFLYDTLAKLEHPLVRQYIHIQKLEWKESFLVATALALAGLKSRFSWMMTAEPELRTLYHGLQQKFFYVTGQGTRMEAWLGSRLRHYNTEVEGAVRALFCSTADAERLRSKVMPLLPKRRVQEDDDDVAFTWYPVAGPNAVSSTVLDFLREHRPGFSCPPHTLNPRTLMGILQRFPTTFEVNPIGMKVRLRPPSSIPEVHTPPPPPTPPAPPAAPAAPVAPALPPIPGRPTPGLMPAPPKPPVSSTGVVPFVMPSTAAKQGESASAPSGGSGEVVTNLVDLLLKEAVEHLDYNTRGKIYKVSDGVYKMGSQEVTFHVINGKLWVWRVGEAKKNIPIEQLLEEEGLAPQKSLTVGTSPAASSHAKQVPAQAAENVARTDASSPATIFHPAVTNLGRENALAATSGAKTGEALKKREEAANKARNAARMLHRRYVNFDDKDLLRLLLLKGLKHDYYWEQAFKAFCKDNSVPELDPKSQKKAIEALDIAKVESFLEDNLQKFLNEEWVKKVLESAKQAGNKEKKDKKEKGKKEKDKKDKKGSSSSNDEKKAGGGKKQPDKRMPPQAPTSNAWQQHQQPNGYNPYGTANPYGMPIMGMPTAGMMAMPPMGYPGMEPPTKRHQTHQGRR